MLARPPLKDRHRSVITVTSANAVAASVQRGEYCVSKAALSMASRLFAVRLSAHSIGVYELQPGMIATEMTNLSRASYDDMINGDHLVTHRWGEPIDVARAALTVAKGQLPYTVGQAIRIDGGLLLPKF
jgi:NAD(P)-dependent dehydrogenase (short-subunit alcohol dehydrogenase family)